ncbi:MAG TPA: tetratricopeptide repeat protein [Chitinophagaceae bacterium]|nr:tetratricopeptide repeat protein [Chitinophagaceae bacterium]
MSVRKPIIQTIIQYLTYLFFGIAAFNFVINTFSNAVAFIDLSISIWATVSIIGLYILLYVLVKKRKIIWQTKEGARITVLSLGRLIVLPLIGVLICLWVPLILNSKKTSNKKLQISNIPETIIPAFDLHDNRFKILILPFRSECEYMGAKYDVGYVISKRLASLNVDDTLGIVVKFLGNEFEVSDFSNSSADTLMKFHNASQVIYGSYSLKECENDGKGRICYNYRTDPMQFYLYGDKQDDTSYHMSEISGLYDIRNGSGQEEIENIIYGFGAFSAFARMNWLKAIRLISKIDNISKYGSFYYLNTYCQFELGNYSESKKLSLRKVEENPSDYVYYNVLGLSCLNLNERKNALEYFSKAIKLNKEYIYSWINLGYYYLRLNNFDSARKCFDVAISIDPKSPIVWRGIGKFYFNNLDYKNAKDCYEKSLNFDSTEDIATMSDLALTYVYLKDTSYAISCLERILKIDSNDYWSLSTIGGLYLNKKEYGKAKSYLERAIKINPNDDETFSKLGAVFQKMEMYKDAVNYFQKSLLLNTNNYNANSNLGKCYFISGDTMKAINFCLSVLQKFPHDDRILSGTYYNLGIFNVHISKEKSLSYFKLAIKKDPSLHEKLQELMLKYKLMSLKEFNQYFN